MSDSQPKSKATPAEVLQTLQAAEDRSAWGPNDYFWNPQTCKAISKSSTSPKEHHPCSAPANLEQAIPELSGLMKPEPDSSDSAPPQDIVDGSGALPVAAPLAIKQASSASYGRPGYCQADGCGKKLSQFTFYHVRNKICDVHIKADQFSREGVFLRFCQRCGYPHPLNEFDGQKHSCRAQLEKHNARRRKRQAEAAAQKGGKQLSLAAARGAAEDGEEKKGGGAVAIKSTKEHQKTQQPARRSNRRHKTRFTAAEVELNEDEDEGDQLLEVTPNPASTKAAAAVASNKTQQSKEKRSVSPSLPFLDFNSAELVNQSGELQQRGEREQHPLFLQNDDLSSWLNTHIAELEDLHPSKPTSTGVWLPPLPQGTSTFDFASGLLHPHTAPPAAAVFASCDGEIPSTSASIEESVLNPFLTSTLPTGAAATPKLTKEAILSMVSVKLFGCTPAELPNDLRQQLATWFNGHAASIEGYLRPGCVHLTVQATVEVERGGGKSGSGIAKRKVSKLDDKNGGNVPHHMSLVTTGGVSCLVDKMLASGEPLWRRKTLLVQAGSDVALVHGGMLKQIWQIGSTPGERAVPAVLEMKPAVLLATNLTHAARTATATKKTCCGGGANETHQEEIIVKGVNLLQDDSEIVCRLQGEYVDVESAGCAECRCSASVKACCQSSGGAASSTTSSAWENKCCGCCVAKLAFLSLSSEPAEKSKSKKKKSSSSCCDTESIAAAEATVSAVTTQSISLKIDSGRSLLCPGVLHIDVLKNTFMAPQGGRILVVDSPDVHAELLNLAECAPAAATAWIDALSIVFEWVGNRQKIEFSLVERTAAKLLHEALGYGLVEVAKYLFELLRSEFMAAASSLALPQGMDGLDALAFFSQADQLCKTVTWLRIMKLGKVGGNDLSNENDATIQSTMSLLHLAVQSQNPAAVELVLGWGRESEVPWRCDLKGPYNLTPLHLSALARDPVISAKLVLTLIASCEPGVQAWKEAMTSDGLSPADFALRLGRVGMLATFGRPVNESEQQLQQQQDDKEEEDVLTALAAKEIKKKEAPCALIEEQTVVWEVAPATPRRCKCTGPCPCAKSAEPCASCSFGSSDDEWCCGGENGQCSCCSGDKTQEKAEMQQSGGGCCGNTTTLVRKCCQ
jgi:hypothetical protein